MQFSPCVILALLLSLATITTTFTTPSTFVRRTNSRRFGWKTDDTGAYVWADDEPAAAITSTKAPPLPSGTLRPKQSLGQNFLQDGNTITKIVNAFDVDMLRNDVENMPVLELGPGLGSLTIPLLERYGPNRLACVEVDGRAIEILNTNHPQLNVIDCDVLKFDYAEYLSSLGSGDSLAIIGNLPYYITSQILFAVCDANHYAPSPSSLPTISSVTVTMQLEVAQRLNAPPSSGKDRGILSVVFELYVVSERAVRTKTRTRSEAKQQIICCASSLRSFVFIANSPPSTPTGTPKRNPTFTSRYRRRSSTQSRKLRQRSLGSNFATRRNYGDG